MTNPLARHLDPLPLIAVLRGITPEEIPAVGAALVGARLRHSRSAAQFTAAVRIDRHSGGEVREPVSRGCGNGHRGRRGGASRRGRRSPHRDASCRHRGDSRGEAAGTGMRSRGRDADGGLCRAQRRCGRAQDVSRGPVAGIGAQGLACGAAAGNAGLRGRRHSSRQHGSLLVGRRQRVRHRIEPLSTRRNGGTCPLRGRRLCRSVPRAAQATGAVTPGSR